MNWDRGWNAPSQVTVNPWRQPVQPAHMRLWAATFFTRVGTVQQGPIIGRLNPATTVTLTSISVRYNLIAKNEQTRATRWLSGMTGV